MKSSNPRFLALGLCESVRAKLLAGAIFVVMVAWQTFAGWAQEPTTKLPNYPLDVVIDNSGSAIVVDRNMHGLWKWTDGKLTKLFEGSPKFRTPMNAARSVALDKDGTVLAGDTSTRDIYRVSADGTAEAITDGEIGMPMDIAVKSDGTIYVADLELRSLLRIPAGSKQVEKVAEVNPRGVFVDSKDQVWVVSQNKQQLLIVSDDGQIEEVVKEPVFEFPHQVVVDSSGTAFVSDGYRRAIWKVAKGAAPEVFFEGDPMQNPVGLALADDKLVVVDPKTRTVYKFDDNAKPIAWFSLDN